MKGLQIRFRIDDTVFWYKKLIFRKVFRKYIRGFFHVLFLFQILGIVIFALTIVGIDASQHPQTEHLFIVILVVVVFMGMVSVADCFVSKG